MLTIDIDTSGLTRLINSLNPDYSVVGMTLSEAGQVITETWQAAASGTKLPGMAKAINQPDYAKSIDYHLRGELDLVIQGDDAATQKIQAGSGSFDMKPRLLAGPHARTGANGTRYNIIPFRHNPANLSQGAMTALIQDLHSFKTNIGRRSKLVNGTAQMTVQGNYVSKGGLRIPANHYTWTTGPESRIRNTQSGPVTWRTVSDKSNPASWWYPSVAQNPIVEAVWDYVKDDVTEAVISAWWEAIGLGFNSG